MKYDGWLVRSCLQCYLATMAQLHKCVCVFVCVCVCVCVCVRACVCCELNGLNCIYKGFCVMKLGFLKCLIKILSHQLECLDTVYRQSFPMRKDNEGKIQSGKCLCVQLSVFVCECKGMCMYRCACVHKRDRAVSAWLVMATWGESHLPFAHTNTNDATRIISPPCHRGHMYDVCDCECGTHTQMNHLGSWHRQTHTCAHTRTHASAHVR